MMDHTYVCCRCGTTEQGVTKVLPDGWLDAFHCPEHPSSIRPFRRPTMSEPIGPDCRDDKHRACNAEALDEATDEIVQCTCGCHTFQRLRDEDRTSGNVWRL